ncbi:MULTISPECIES: hypothetical protein [Oceanobacillus]|uniref:Uncharacterized protein n=2 Tax=Oceanobacillus TaxID=182709 RepID=A0ABV9K057_9BACI|nr:hypothetical protein [Oceanobacillus oncorhynchi]MDM8098719.1 hypothetical protein [Oceanobacillus oncorhynchi]
MREPKSRLNKLFDIILLLAIVVTVIMWIFNLSFSLPTTFDKVVEDNAGTTVNDIEKIEIEMTGEIPEDFNNLSDYIPPEDERRFVMEGSEQISKYINSDYRIYQINSVDRVKDDKENEYLIEVELRNGDSLSYTVGKGYVIDNEGVPYEVLDDKNALYRNVISLFEH